MTKTMATVGTAERSSPSVIMVNTGNGARGKSIIVTQFHGVEQTT
jgi:hypothetical protein